MVNFMLVCPPRSVPLVAYPRYHCSERHRRVIVSFMVHCLLEEHENNLRGKECHWRKQAKNHGLDELFPKPVL